MWKEEPVSQFEAQNAAHKLIFLLSINIEDSEFRVNYEL
jgi:hypothetical protein